jgi:hypothetical protein
MESAWASLRQFQWVLPSGGGWSVRRTIRACTDGVVTRGRLPLCLGLRPSMRCSSKRARQRASWCSASLHLPIAQTAGRSQNQTRTEHVAGGQSARLRPARQFLALIVGNRKHAAILSHGSLDEIQLLTLSPGQLIKEHRGYCQNRCTGGTK